MAADTHRLIPLINAAFAVDTFVEGNRTNSERMAQAMDKGAFLLAEDGDGSLAATLYLELRGERGYMGLVAVDPARQRTGIGRRLMLAAEDYLRQRGCVAVDIVVLSPRTDLPPLYQNLGYAETGRKPMKPDRKLRDGFECEGIMMSKNL